VALFGNNEAVGIAFQGKDQVSPVVRGIRSTMDQFKRDAQTGFGLGAGISVFNLATDALRGVIDFMGDSVTAASDLAESQSKVNVVFADGADDVHEWAETAATSMGMARREALEAAGTFGNFIQALGNSREEAQDMSLSLVELAADLASFNNTDISEVILALRSGLAGEAEPMRRLGVSISATRVEANILAKGLARTKAEITDAMKVSERYAIIMEDTALAQGDFERTSDGLANQTKILNAQLSTSSEEIGQKLLPSMLKLVNLANQFVVPALGAVADSLGFVTGEQTGAMSRLEGRIEGLASEGNNAVAMAARLQKEMGAVSISTMRAGVTMDDLALETDEEADAAKEAAEAAKILNDAMSALANDGLAEVASGAKEAKRRIRDLLHGGDERKSVRQLRAELTRLERQKRRAANQGRVDAFAAIEQREGEIRAHLRQRGVVRGNMEKFKDAERQKQTSLGMTEGMLDAVKDAVNAIPNKATVNVSAPGADAVIADFQTILGIYGQLPTSVPNPAAGWPKGGGNAGRQRGERAHGGEVGSRGTYLVGERGPELLHMGAGSGRITPNHRMGGGGGNVYLDGQLVGRVLDERMGRQFGMTAAGGFYRS
jgi:hypothetical protein